MEERSTGMDREVKTYFGKIMKSFTAGMLWMMVMTTAGLFFRLGHVNKGWQWYNTLFYGLLIVSFSFLLRYYYNVWKKRE